MVNCRF
ncbi:hypothetical protein F383_03015 [Gossypium arboreum]|nr:hypothetical protein F383_03015 [Gossypium arboreum]